MHALGRGVAIVYECECVFAAHINNAYFTNMPHKVESERVTKLSTHPALRRRGDVAATSLCTSQWRRRYVSNETPNDVSMERRQDVSVVRLYDVLLERHNDVSKGRNNDAPSLPLLNVSNKS